MPGGGGRRIIRGERKYEETLKNGMRHQRTSCQAAKGMEHWAKRRGENMAASGVKRWQRKLAAGIGGVIEKKNTIENERKSS